MDRSSSVGTRRLDALRNKIIVRLTIRTLTSCWLIALCLAFVWCAMQATIFPHAPEWVGLTVLGGMGVISTLGGILWTIRRIPVLVVSRRA